MRFKTIYGVLFLLAMTVLSACGHKAQDNESTAVDSTQSQTAKPNAPIVFKGTYSCAPGARIFQFCNQKKQFWAVDSSAQLELKYSQIYTFEQAGSVVYAEVEGYKTKSAAGGEAAAYDSTLVVKKVITITKNIPAGCK